MLNDEPEGERFEEAVEADRVRLLSSASYPGTAIVTETRFATRRTRTGLVAASRRRRCRPRRETLELLTSPLAQSEREAAPNDTLALP